MTTTTIHTLYIFTMATAITGAFLFAYLAWQRGRELGVKNILGKSKV